MFMVIFTTAVQAQTKKGKMEGFISGKSSQTPIEYATVTLHKTGEQQILAGTTTDSLGHFVLDKLPYGAYTLECTYLGMKTMKLSSQSVSKEHPTLNIGNLKMVDTTTTLDEVTVQGHRSTYVQTIDKKIFNVGSDLTSGAGSVSDLMQNIPSVQVDVEGNISLRGNENVQVLINGKPSVMLKGANRGTVLQQLSASIIERVEVITNPSAQLKPDGTSGIINIVLKKERKKGFTGSVTANTGNENRYNGTLSLGYNTPNLNLTGSYGFRLDRRDRSYKTDRTVTDSVSLFRSSYHQDVDSRARSAAHIGSLEIGWDLSTKNHFEVSGNYTYMTFPRNEGSTTIQQNETEVQKYYSRFRHDDEKQQQTEGTALYVHEFAKGHTLTLDYTYAIQKEIEDNHYTNHYFIPINSEDEKDNTFIKQNNYENLSRAIYERNLHHHNKLVLGYELEADKSDMRYFAEDFVNGSWEKNTAKSNDFIFNEQVHSLYVTYEQTLGQFGFQAGIRGEQSYTKSKLLTLNENIPNNYFMLYPTLHTAYKVNNYSELQFNYSLRVNRPEGDDLNPFPEYKDPYNIKRGNPYLMPEKIHSIEFGYLWKKDVTTLVGTMYYHNTFNKMTEITRMLDANRMETTKENMSSSQSAGVELIANSAIGRFLDFNINSNVFYNVIDASDLGYNKKKSAIAWMAALNANISATQNLMFQFNTRYNSSVLTPQGKKESTFITNIGFRYDIPHYNLSLMATISDLFDTNRSVEIIDTPFLYQRLEKRRNPRNFYVGISYKFGNSKKKHKSTELKYDDTL